MTNTNFEGRKNKKKKKKKTTPPTTNYITTNYSRCLNRKKDNTKIQITWHNDIFYCHTLTEKHGRLPYINHFLFFNYILYFLRY
jgi:hypothetical protein